MTLLSRIARRPITDSNTQLGRARTAALLWLLGVPLPIVLIVLLLRGC